MKRIKSCLLIILSIGISLGCHSQPTLYKEYGQASYYANWLHGYHTANGERLNNQNFTAAHRYLPFNTIVKITNPENDSFVYVRINDRGPFKRTRIIDITKVAADRLNMIRKGIIDVLVEEIPLLNDSTIAFTKMTSDSTFPTFLRSSKDSIGHQDTFYFLITRVLNNSPKEFDIFLKFLNSRNLTLVCMANNNLAENSSYNIYLAGFNSRENAIKTKQIIETRFQSTVSLKFYLR